MTLFTHAEEAQVAQEVVATALAGALHIHGSQKAFAREAGITPVFVNNVIKHKRMPSLRMARQIAPFLPLSPADQTAWLANVEGYWLARNRLRQSAGQRLADDPAAAVRDIMAQRLTTFSADPNAVRRGWMLATHIGEAVAQEMSTQAHAPFYLEYCDTMFEAYSVLGRHVDALRIAKRKQLVAAMIDASPRRFGLHLSLEEFDRNKVNAQRLEMVSLIELGLYTEAYDLSQKIEASAIYKSNADFWVSMLTWDRLNALRHLPRSSIRDARRMAHVALRVCDNGADDWQALAHMLVARSLAGVCVSRGHASEARVLLNAYRPTLDHTPHCGVFHKVLFLRAWAEVLRAQNELEEWRSTLDEAGALTQQAGLLNEMAAIERERGREQIQKRRPLP